MRRSPSVAATVGWSRRAAYVIQIPRLPGLDQARHAVQPVHTIGAPGAPHRPRLNRRRPRRPALTMPRARPVLQPASRLSLRRPRSPRTTPLTTKPLVRRACHERPATTRTHPLLRHKPQPHPARPAPTNIHLRPTRPTPTLPVTPRRVPPMTTLTNFQSGSIRSNPFILFETAGREAKTAAVGWPFMA